MINSIERSDKMGWKEKEYRKTQKANRGGKETDSISPFDEEMLRIQGLIRCKECDMPYPYVQRNCPHCNAPNTDKYPLR